MNKKVKIKKDKLGNVIRLSKNPEYGYVVLKQKRLNINVEGWVNAKKFTALLKGRVEDLKDMDLENTKTLPGNIIVRESTIPFNSENPERDLKIAGDTGIILCTEDGEPIYRKTIYDQSGTMIDVLVPHAKINYENIDDKDSSEESLEDDDNQLNIFSEESTIEDEVEELLEDSNEEEVEQPIEESKVDLGSIGNKFEEEEIQENFVELEDEFTFDIEG